MKQMMIFVGGLSVLSSLTIGFINLAKTKFSSNRLFIFISFFIALEYFLVTLINILPFSGLTEILVKVILFIPVPVFLSGLFMAMIFPSGRISKYRPLIVLFLTLVLSDVTLLFLNPFSHSALVNADLTLTANPINIIQVVLGILLVVAIPVVMLARNSGTKFRRLRSVVWYYAVGMILICVIMAAFYGAGVYFFQVPYLKNPALPFPVFFMLLLTNHYVYEFKESNFKKYYIFLVYAILTFALLYFPAYFFLRYAPSIPVIRDFNILVKGLVILIYFVVTYRMILPVRKLITRRGYHSALHSLNETIVPVRELNRISENSSFWRNITNDNFQGLKNAIGATSAYFLLFDRKSNGFLYTYGFGRELSESFIEAESEIIKFLSRYRSVFERSDLLTDYGLENVHPDVIGFLDKNEIDVSMPFMNMADSIIGFLLLGKIRKGRPYDRDILDALEIYRVKLQSLLITGLILDEVTAEQVSEHDRIVMNVVKQRIIPAEMDTVRGIRMSSMHINNSDAGGDYFDAVRLSREKTAIFMADLAYNGVDSALMGLELYSMLHSRSMIFSFPEKMLNMMNQVLSTSRITSNYVRCCGVIVSSDGNYLYANASFNPMLIFDHDKDGFSEIESAGIPIGIEMEHRYALTSGRLREGCIAFLYSDGLFSACNSSGEIFSMESVQEVIRRHWRESPAVIIREIYSVFRSFTGDTTQLNDVSLVVFKKVKTDD